MENYLQEVLHGMQWIRFHGGPKFVSSPPQRGGSNTKLGDYNTSKFHHVPG